MSAADPTYTFGIGFPEGEDEWRGLIRGNRGNCLTAVYSFSIVDFAVCSFRFFLVSALRPSLGLVVREHGFQEMRSSTFDEALMVFSKTTMKKELWDSGSSRTRSCCGNEKLRKVCLSFLRSWALTTTGSRVASFSA